MDWSTCFELEYGRYRHAPIRSDTSIRVYTTANTDTDTSTPYIGVPATYIIRPGRLLGERSLYAMGGTCRPLATNQLARSVSCKTGCFTGTLEWLTVDCCYHFLLVEGVRRHLSSSVLRRLGVMGMHVSGYLLPPSAPPTLSPIVDQMAHARRVMERECPLIVLCSATC